MNLYAEPVVGKNFFAREDMLESLLKSASDIKSGYRHNTAIIGKGLIGKSSLLLHFLGLIKDDDRLIPVYITLKGAGFTDFTDNYIIALLYHSLKKRRDLQKTDDLNYLIDEAKRHFPKTVDLIIKIKDLIKEGSLDEAYSALWDLNVVLTSESDQFPVIVWDEFNQISSFGLKKPFQVFGQKIMVQQKTLFILSSSCALTARKILAEKLSLLFGGFKTMDIGPFTLQQAGAFIDSQGRGLNLSKDLRDFLIDFTGGHPFYLSSIIRRLHSVKAYGADKISSRHLSQVIAEILFHPSGVINRFFTDYLKQACSGSTTADIYDILKIILSSGRSSDILKRSTVPSAQLLGLLNELLELGLVSKSGSLYAVTDAVFRMWIDIKSRPKNLCFNFIPQEEGSSYVREVEEKIAQSKAERRCALDELVIELAGSFKNDQFFIGERLRLLPQLCYVRQRRLSPECTLLLMRAKKDWLFILPSKRINDEYVYNIVEKIRLLRYNLARVVLVAAADIDDSAKLIAKQKRFWVWNTDDLNRLFLFYKGRNAMIA